MRGENPEVWGLWDRSLHMLQKITDGVHIGVCQSITLVLSMGSFRVGQPVNFSLNGKGIKFQLFACSQETQVAHGSSALVATIINSNVKNSFIITFDSFEEKLPNAWLVLLGGKHSDNIGCL